jgi:hypothetical protein
VAVNDTEGTEDDAPKLIASEVDELTHAELLCLYQVSEENIRFSKLLQWRTTGGTLAIYVLFLLMASTYAEASMMTKILTRHGLNRWRDLEPYTPKTNGKAERFIQSSLREWAYATAYETSDHRAEELPHWLHRPHAGIKGK